MTAFDPRLFPAMRKCNKGHDCSVPMVSCQQCFDEFTDRLTCGLDKLMNYIGGGWALAGARDEIKAMRTVIREYRGEMP